MFRSPRFGFAMLLLGVGTAIAFAGGLARSEMAFPPATDAPLIGGGDGLSVSMLTGAYVPR